MKTESEVEYTFWDWREPAERKITLALRKMGIHVYKDPNTRGMDCTGVIISKKPLTPKEIRKICRCD